MTGRQSKARAEQRPRAYSVPATGTERHRPGVRREEAVLPAHPFGVARPPHGPRPHAAHGPVDNLHVNPRLAGNRRHRHNGPTETGVPQCIGLADGNRRTSRSRRRNTRRRFRFFIHALRLLRRRASRASPPRWTYSLPPPRSLVRECLRATPERAGSRPQHRHGASTPHGFRVEVAEREAVDVVLGAHKALPQRAAPVSQDRLGGYGKAASNTRLHAIVSLRSPKHEPRRWVPENDGRDDQSISQRHSSA